MPRPMACPDDRVLSEFLDRALAPSAVQALELHIDVCPLCRTALSQVVRARRTVVGAEGTPPEEVAATEPEGIGSRVGRYRLIDVLGAGGMGVVYLARDPELDRRVAVKVLRDDADRSNGDDRLRIEAQTLARVSHPNVLAVYDVGRIGRRIFLAMELVDGATLRRHLGQRDLAWRERLRLLVESGRGLAAAHAVGVIHRDVKPDNVLVGADGRARVADFGLARAPAPVVSPAGSAVSTAAGTPAYLAPELRDGASATAASDQYAFATMCWELLYGERPAAAPPLPRGGRERRRVARALRRALAAEPAARWPSLVLLVDALDAPVRPPTPWPALLAVAVLGGAVALAFTLRPDRHTDAAAVCAAQVAVADELWTDARAAAVRDVFAGTASTQASAVAATVDAGLRQTATDWRAAVATACRRDPVGFAAGAGPVECLSRRQAQAEALAASFMTADKEIVDRAVAAVAALATPASCLDDARALEPPRPATWIALARRIAIAGTDIELGRYDEARAAADAVVRDADTAGALALRAEALDIAAEVERIRGNLDEARRLLTDATTTADHGGADYMRAKTLLDLVWLAVADELRVADAEPYLTLARGAVARLGEPPSLVVPLAECEAKVAMLRGDPAAAVAPLLQAIAITRSAHLNRLSEPGLRNELASAYLMLGRNAEALAEFEQVAATLEGILGPDHLNVGAVYSNIAATLSRLARSDEAEARAERAVAIMRAALGDSRKLTQGLANLGVLQGQNGHTEAGIATLEEALRMTERLLGPVHLDVALFSENLARLQNAAGRPPEAVATLGRAIEILATLGDQPTELAGALNDLAAIELAAGHPRAAVSAAERSAQVVGSNATAEERRRNAAILEAAHAKLVR